MRSSRRLLALVSLLSFAHIATARLAPAQAVGTAPKHLVEVFIRDAQSLAGLMQLDLDLAACSTIELPAKVVEVLATDADIALLRREGFDLDVAIRDLETHYARQLAAWGSSPSISFLQTSPAVGQGSMGGHFTLAEMESILDDFAADHPAICAQKVSIGTSIEGRDLWMVKISDNVGVDEDEPEAYYDSLHHAREPVSLTTTLQFMDELLDGYGSDPEATYIIDNRELYFVPCVNPDGYEYNRVNNPGGGGLWRKNRRNNGGGSFGVDLNRNYATGWTAPFGGNSTDPNSTTYRGPAPFSEPETAALEAFVSSRNFTQSCSCHTSGEILLRPWGYQSGDPANGAEYEEIGARVTALSGMPHGGGADLLYFAAGTTLDHHHVAHGALGWTPELGTQAEGGWWPAPPEQVAIAQRQQDMYRQLAITAGGVFAFVDVTVEEDPSADGDGSIEPGEGAIVSATIRNCGLAPIQGAQLSLSVVNGSAALHVSSISLATVARLTTLDTAATPLTFTAGAGDPAKLRLTLTGDGKIETRDFAVGPLRLAVGTDMEVDHGFVVSATPSASTGNWARGAPEQTVFSGDVIQPGSQNTPGGSLCWVTDPNAGSGAGVFDVDGGPTELVSPPLDLSHLVAAELRFAAWLVDSQSNDSLDLDVTSDGGANWTRIWSTSDSDPAWTQTVVPLLVPLTDQMQFRFRVADDFPSLLEAAIDDFEIHGVTADANCTLLTSGILGTDLRLGYNGRDGAVGYPLLAFGLAAAPIPVPGFDGLLRLDPATMLGLGSTQFGSTGSATFDLQLPNDPGAVGLPLHFQVAQVDGANFRLGNVQSVTLQ